MRRERGPTLTPGVMNFDPKNAPTKNHPQLEVSPRHTTVRHRIGRKLSHDLRDGLRHLTAVRHAPLIEVIPRQPPGKPGTTGRRTQALPEGGYGGGDLGFC